MNSLAPTHAMFYRSAAEVGPTSCSPAPSRQLAQLADFNSGLGIRKYLIVRDSFAATHSPLRVILFSHELQHKDLVPLRCDPVSAGSFFVVNHQAVLTGIGSETLNLPSRPHDAALIQSLLSESA
jgi:hypothetical protein